MKKGLFVVVLLLIPFMAGNVLAASEKESDKPGYGDEWFDDYRKITYWGRLEFSVEDYIPKSGDAAFLKLVVKGEGEKDKERPREDLKQHFLSEFKKLFGQFNFPIHDIDAGREERFQKYLKEHGWERDASEVYEEWLESEFARRRSLYRGRAGAVYLQVKVRRRESPVLYEIRCSVSAKDDLSYSRSNESSDLGFGSPERIGDDIKTALTEMLKKKSVELSNIMKYKK